MPIKNIYHILIRKILTLFNALFKLFIFPIKTLMMKYTFKASSRGSLKKMILF